MTQRQHTGYDPMAGEMEARRANPYCRLGAKDGKRIANQVLDNNPNAEWDEVLASIRHERYISTTYQRLITKRDDMTGGNAWTSYENEAERSAYRTWHERTGGF